MKLHFLKISMKSERIFFLSKLHLRKVMVGRKLTYMYILGVPHGFTHLLIQTVLSFLLGS